MLRKSGHDRTYLGVTRITGRATQAGSTSNCWDEEINTDRLAHGKNPLAKKSVATEKEVKTSTTAPESGLLVKGEKERVFAYSFHTACDRNGFVARRSDFT